MLHYFIVSFFLTMRKIMRIIKYMKYPKTKEEWDEWYEAGWCDIYQPDYVQLELDVEMVEYESKLCLKKQSEWETLGAYDTQRDHGPALRGIYKVDTAWEVFCLTNKSPKDRAMFLAKQILENKNGK